MTPSRKPMLCRVLVLALRCQRVVFQQWKEDVPWVRAGQVTIELGGDIAKEAGVLPHLAALEPMALPPGAEPQSKVQLFLVALNDNGKSGRRVGCDDSLVPVERSITPTSDRATIVKSALELLLAIRQALVGDSGLYGALSRARLKVDAVSIGGSRAVIRLSGQATRGGVCDDPRFDAQILETARQFSWLTDVTVLVNGTRLGNETNSNQSVR